MVIRERSVWVNRKTGELYRVLHLAKHSETEEPMVVYRKQGDTAVWVRPYDLFLMKFDWMHD